MLKDDGGGSPDVLRPASSITVPVEFTANELWYLRSVVRHEGPNMREWKYPIVSLDLNDQIAMACLVAFESKEQVATLILGRGDCLLLDAIVDQTAKTAAGEPLGQIIMMKVLHARRDIAMQESSFSLLSLPSSTDPVTKEQLAAALDRLRGENEDESN